MRTCYHPLAALLLSIVGIFTACKKDDESATGAIDGQFDPSNGGGAITISRDSLHWDISTAPNASGYFLLNNLAPGRYYLSLLPAPGLYLRGSRPPDVVQVVSGRTTHLGTFYVAHAPTASFLLDGNPVTASSVYIGSDYRLRMSTPDDYRLFFRLPGTTLSPLGSYQFSFWNQASYERFSNGPCGWSRWCTLQSGSGSVTVTRSDAVRRLISGTFAYTADYDASNSGTCDSGTKHITSGVFTDVPLN